MSFTPDLKSLTKAVSCALCALMLLCGCGVSTTASATEAPTATTAATEEAIEYTVSEEETNYVAITMNDGGVMIMELYPDVAPITVANFKKLVSEHFYDGLIFHRVIKDFMIQTGDPTGTGSGGSEETIKGEFATNGVTNNLKHTRGVVSMARLGSDNDSASSQFFIVHKDYPSLNGQYAAFGKLIYGYDTLDKIASTEVSGSRPVEKQIMQSVTFVNVTE